MDFKGNSVQKMSEYDNVQKTLFCSLVSSMNLGLKRCFTNISRLFHFSALFIFTTSETELDCIYLHIGIAPQVGDRLKT